MTLGALCLVLAATQVACYERDWCASNFGTGDRITVTILEEWNESSSYRYVEGLGRFLNEDGEYDYFPPCGLADSLAPGDVYEAVLDDDVWDQTDCWSPWCPADFVRATEPAETTAAIGSQLPGRRICASQPKHVAMLTPTCSAVQKIHLVELDPTGVGPEPDPSFLLEISYVVDDSLGADCSGIEPLAGYPGACVDRWVVDVVDHSPED